MPLGFLLKTLTLNVSVSPKNWEVSVSLRKERQHLKWVFLHCSHFTDSVSSWRILGAGAARGSGNVGEGPIPQKLLSALQLSLLHHPLHQRTALLFPLPILFPTFSELCVVYEVTWRARRVSHKSGDLGHFLRPRLPAHSEWRKVRPKESSKNHGSVKTCILSKLRLLTHIHKSHQCNAIVFRWYVYRYMGVSLWLWSQRAYLLTSPLSRTHPALLTSITITLYTEEDCVLFPFSHLTMKDTKAWKVVWISHDCKAERLNKGPKPGLCIANPEFFLLRRLTSPLPKCLLSPNNEKCK